MLGSSRINIKIRLMTKNEKLSAANLANGLLAKGRWSS